MDFSSDVTERMCKEFLTTMGNLIDCGFIGQRKGMDEMGIGDRRGNFVLAFRE
jgi:hypothetical protein